jgi:hypothetical protein
MILARHCSPDKALTLIVEQLGDDLQVGFDGMSWHTHGDILAQKSDVPVQVAVARFVSELLAGRHLLALLRMNGALVDAWVTDDPAKDASYAQPGEVLEFRRWDGTQADFKAPQR